MTTFPTPDPIAVTIDLIGDVRITASDRTDTVVVVRPGDPSKSSDIKAAEQTTVEYGDGGLIIKAPRHWRRYTPFGGIERVDVTLELPTGSQVTADSGLGDFSGDGELGACRLKTSMGNIRLDQTGPLQATTGYGNIAVDHIAGDAELKTGSGAIRTGVINGAAVIKNANGDTSIGEVARDLRVKAANGDVTVGVAHASASVKTASGDIRIAEVRRGAIGLETAAGELEIGIREGTAAWLDVVTRFGSVRNTLGSADGPASSDATVEVHARTSFGDILIVRPPTDETARERVRALIMAAHEHVHLDDADWEAAVAYIELEGEVLLGFVTDAAAWVAELRGPDAPPVRRILDIGSGPGVGTGGLARQFPDAQVIAVDGSRAMLGHAAQRAAAQRLDARITTHVADLPDGLDGLGPADMIWASMALHHIGDEVGSLRILHDLLDPRGLIAIAERAEPVRVLPDDLALGRPGLADRLDHASSQWFAGMRAGLTDSVPSADLPSMLTAAGFEVVGSRLGRVQLDAPLGHDARRFVVGHLRRRREHAEHLEHDDVSTLDILIDPDDPLGVMHRSDVFVHASRQIVVARATAS